MRAPSCAVSPHTATARSPGAGLSYRHFSYDIPSLRSLVICEARRHTLPGIAWRLGETLLGDRREEGGGATRPPFQESKKILSILTNY